MNTNNIYKSIIAFMLFFTPLEVLSQSDTVSNITNKHFDSNPSYEYATASTVLTQSDIVTQDILFAPKSPTVAGLAQAIDCPVSYYTGTPEINIPLYTIPLRGLELPINLSYHASGIKVAQEASWVGLGWNLNCAGMITRTVKCGDDFHEYGAGHDNGIEEGYYFAPEAKAPIDKSYFKTNNLGASWLLVKDSEPDVFCYCIPGSSGKFLVDKTRGPILLSCTGKNHVQIKIHGKSVNKSGSFTFEVVDTYGNQYFFELKETTHCFHRNNELNMNYTLTQAVCDEFEQRVSDMYPSSFDYTSSWLLTKIVTSKKQVITFEYEAENYQLPTVESVLKYNLLNTSGNGYTMSSSPQYSCSKTMIEGYHLVKIAWDAGSINFQTTTREDIKACNSMYPLNVPKKLVGLYIKDKMNEIIKSYSFSYKYMNANRTDSYAHVFKRLMLVSVIDNTDKTIKYSMEYYPGDLPAKNSNNTDSWGYSNGSKQGANFYFPASYNGILYHGADKTPNLNSMRVGTLQKLKFPTGEEYEYNYEVPTSKTPPTPVSKKITASLGACYTDKVDDEEYTDIPRTRTETIKIDTYTVFDIYGYAENLLIGSSDLSYLYDNESYPVFRVYRIKKDGSKNEDWYYSLTAPNEMINARDPYQYPSYKLGLPAGTYSFEIYSPIKDAYFVIYYTYTGTYVEPGVEVPIGGLRIKEIRGSETRSFNYSGGNLLMPQTTSYVYNLQYFQDASNNSSKTYLVQSSHAVTPMSTLKDGYIYGYNNVKETCGKYSVSYEYINEPEMSQEENYPFIPTILNCKNGLLKKKSIFYEWETCKQVEEYDYDTFDNKKVFGFVYMPHERNVHSYIYDIEQPLLTSARKKTYYGNDFKEEEMYYSYNPYFQLSEKETITSLGTYKDVCLYPSDKNDNLYKQMTEANIVGIPIESQSYLNEKIISANKTEYGKQGNTYVPFAQYKAEMNTPIDVSVLKNAYVKRKDLGHYSSYGNPREIEENHTTTILIWSYLGMYPIAKIKNCSYSELIQYLPESTLNTIEARSVPTENDWKQIEKLRLQLPHAMTMTMEYKPFVGIIRQTDERGFSTYFTYDNSGRLIEAYFYENDKKMILKKYSYHYQTK